MGKMKGEAGKKNALRPFLKWAGGKGQLLEKIRENYPDGLGRDISKYAEPFVGGGAVLFDILNDYPTLQEVFICDVNPELINAYRTVRNNAPALISLLQRMEEEYLSAPIGERREIYYRRREEFNQRKLAKTSEEDVDKAALLIFLNKTCFNGLYRVNRQGLFNVPMGDYRSPSICDSENLSAVSAALQKVQIVCGDYRQSADFIDHKTFVYFDPPYRPLTETANFTAYSSGSFDDVEQANLADFVKEMDLRGARIALSNSDPKNVDPSDNFLDLHYLPFYIRRVDASRFINSNAGARGKIRELLITSYEPAGRKKKGNTSGGGAKTNLNGLRFEQDTSLETALIRAGYQVVGGWVFQGTGKVAQMMSKTNFYKFLSGFGIRWEERISRKLLPDEALYNLTNNTVYIIEKKFQKAPGSTDEKLQTCGFKKMEYEKLLEGTGIRVEYVYICNDYFHQHCYDDVFAYIRQMKCHYFFDEIPVEFLELPPVQK